jgi:hypothetical protein
MNVDFKYQLSIYENKSDHSDASAFFDYSSLPKYLVFNAASSSLS